MPEIVNVVGSGSLDTEFDLERVAADIGSIAEYDPDKYPGIICDLRKMLRSLPSPELENTS